MDEIVLLPCDFIAFKPPVNPPAFGGFGVLSEGFASHATRYTCPSVTAGDALRFSLSLSLAFRGIHAPQEASRPHRELFKLSACPVDIFGFTPLEGLVGRRRVSFRAAFGFSGALCAFLRAFRLSSRSRLPAVFRGRAASLATPVRALVHSIHPVRVI